MARLPRVNVSSLVRAHELGHVSVRLVVPMGGLRVYLTFCRAAACGRSEPGRIAAPARDEGICCRHQAALRDGGHRAGAPECGADLDNSLVRTTRSWSRRGRVLASRAGGVAPNSSSRGRGMEYASSAGRSIWDTARRSCRVSARVIAMKLRWFSVIGAFAAAAVGSLGVVSTYAADRSNPKPSEQSLRALAARHGLYVGTAVDMQALDDPADTGYRALVASQFSTVTAENVMKWALLEPTRGTYDWRAADELIEFARKNNQRVRGHVLVWQNQLPKWLTDGVDGGTISKDELRALLQKHVTDVVTHFKGKIWQWDVVNEALSDPWDTPNEIHYKGFWNEHYGPGYIADAFR